MAKPLQRARAIALRKLGLSISEIVVRIGESKSTVSYWCRDVELTQSQIHQITRRGRRKANDASLRSAEKQRKQRILRTKSLRQQGARRVGILNERELFLFGVALYWGEGYKKSTSEFGFTNSDKAMLLTYIRWLRLLGVHSEQLILRVTVNRRYAARANKIQTYWSNELHVPLSQFTKPSIVQIESTVQYPCNTTYVGTVRIKVRNGSHLLQYVLGAIARVARNSSPAHLRTTRT